jgi:RNA polymerase sigma-W factor
VQKDKIQDFIERALKGDQSACRDLVKRYERGIYNMIYQMVKNREEAEDLVQETFIKAFNALDSYNNQFAFSTWLYKIAFNNCIDSIRKHKLKTYPLDRPIETREGSVQQEIRDDSTSPEKEMLFLEKRKQINQAIRCLPEKYKRVILLRHQEEKTYEEIAEIMNIPLGTVKARIFRAREMLKRCIQE